ncbi:hypothetical protein BE20_44000 [Sorangium cellulosum]|uniref:Transposase (putative) YhgA-like domain-containing protein n=1 Tax=Sorangium cellulosum TaxID=56 RepID=A0A150SU47_SORCE|nr:hypothetical protein BE18_39095 [Sorangium cellulosum]KYF95850.1 hypothetical protein BE20_44000 [Sorangium cellulosum]
MIHEALLHLFRNRPTLAAEVLRDTLGAPVPRFTEARIEPADLTEIVPVEHRADLVVLLLDGRPVLAIVVEAQLGRDPDKEYAWPSYLVAVRARYRCRACLLVATTDEAIAAWSAQPIDLGPPDWVLRPYVLGPSAVPVVTEPADARARPEVAVLSVMAHGQSAAGLAIAMAALAAAAGLDQEQQALYLDVVLSSLNEAARRSLEAKMKSGYEFQSDFARNYVAKGRRQEAANAVLTVLEARGLDIPPEVRERVLASTDMTELDRWLRRAVLITDAKALLDSTGS